MLLARVFALFHWQGHEIPEFPTLFVDFEVGYYDAIYRRNRPIVIGCCIICDMTWTTLFVLDALGSKMTEQQYDEQRRVRTWGMAAQVLCSVGLTLVATRASSVKVLSWVLSLLCVSSQLTSCFIVSTDAYLVMTQSIAVLVVRIYIPDKQASNFTCFACVVYGVCLARIGNEVIECVIHTQLIVIIILATAYMSAITEGHGRRDYLMSAYLELSRNSGAEDKVIHIGDMKDARDMQAFSRWVSPHIPMSHVEDDSEPG